LHRLGERESGTARLEEAVTAYREALAVFKESGASHYEGMASRNLARAEALLRARKSS
jgi:exonuclease VII small subunit